MHNVRENSTFESCYFSGGLHRDYRPNREFAALYTRQGLLKLCDYRSGHDMDYLIKKPVSELRDYYVANAPVVPEDIKHLFETTLHKALSAFVPDAALPPASMQGEGA